MALDEIRVLLRFEDAPGAGCGDINALLDEHIGHVAQRVRGLLALEQPPLELRETCRSVQDAGHCGISNQLDTMASGELASWRPLLLPATHTACAAVAHREPQPPADSGLRHPRNNTLALGGFSSAGAW